MPRPRSFDRDHVATILREALELGLPTASTIMEVFGVTKYRANYMIRVVKEDGLLGVKGHEAVVAILTRGASDGTRRILACETCRMTWPCDKAWPGTVPTARKGNTRDRLKVANRRGTPRR